MKPNQTVFGRGERRETHFNSHHDINLGIAESAQYERCPLRGLLAPPVLR
jgi:hypothetical protein